MRLIPIVLGVAALARAFTIPNGYEEGTFAVTYDETGKEIHTRVAEPITPLNGANDDTSPATSGLVERGKSGHEIFCLCEKLSQPHTDAAVADLKNQFPMGGEYKGAPNYYSIRGDVVAFACNVKGHVGFFVKNATPLLITQILEYVTGSCGRYYSGWGFFSNTLDWAKDEKEAAAFGYMKWRKGLNFCNNLPILRSDC